MLLINEIFPDAKSYATEANARRKLEKFKDAIPERVPALVLPRPDGRWIAVVFKRDNQTFNIPYLCANGICVTN
jgi:hypothetical protein